MLRSHEGTANLLRSCRLSVGNHLHLAPISVKSKFGLDADQGTMKLRYWVFLDKTGTRVERGIPRDVRVGAKRDAVAAALLRLNFAASTSARPQPFRASAGATDSCSK